ncbi:hypothetical protein DPM19_02690 [Actinomadura craniellae]|uniref:Uncharacterized protein n=1 Tax=Actinomadura craniellae TaxID=2231787 RepID=A0A365HGZ9_9ACTN|nr:hypothetical protein DPM19_02690 [Actinomadura craniellae]
MRPGDQLASTVCSTRVVVVRAPAEERPEIACGGDLMVPAVTAQAAPSSAADAATLIGKRYVDAGGKLELLCISSGAGELSCAGTPMTLKAAKPLPASD